MLVDCSLFRCVVDLERFDALVEQLDVADDGLQPAVVSLVGIARRSFGIWPLREMVEELLHLGRCSHIACKFR